VKVGLKTVTDIKFLARQGLSKTAIGRRLGLNRKTVRKYLNNPDAVEERKPRSSIIDPYRPYIKSRLQEYPQLTATRLYREISGHETLDGPEVHLLPEEPYDGSVRTVRRHVARMRPGPKRVYKPVETLPGEQAQVDWGEFGHIEIDGQKKKLYGFSFVLSYSRIRYVEYTTSQDMTTFLNCHKRALQYIGGVPQRILYDNCKTVVIDRMEKTVQFNNDLLRFAAGYSFLPDACWVNDPESKGKVESTIKYVRSDFFYARPIIDLDTLNSQVLRWCDEVANEKKHSATMEKPSDRLGAERRALGCLPDYQVPVFSQCTRRVRKDCTFSYETNQYSVPHQFSRSMVLLHVYEDRLEVHHNRKLIAVHRRSYERGQLILDEEHYQNRPSGARKRKSKLQADFDSIGPRAGDYLKGLARERRGGLRDHARGILALCEDYGKEAVHEAMLRAENYNNYSCAAIERILQKQRAHPQALPDDPRSRPEGEELTAVSVEVQRRDPDYYSEIGEEVATES